MAITEELRGRIRLVLSQPEPPSHENLLELLREVDKQVATPPPMFTTVTVDAEGRRTVAGPSCTFCSKNRREVKNLISGGNAFICDECVALCHDIVGGH